MIKYFLPLFFTTLTLFAQTRAMHFDRLGKMEFAQYSDLSVRGFIEFHVDVADCYGAFSTRSRISQSSDPEVIQIYELELYQTQTPGPQGACELKPIVDFNFPNIDFETGKKITIRLHNPSRNFNESATIEDFFIFVNEKNQIEIRKKNP